MCARESSNWSSNVGSWTTERRYHTRVEKSFEYRTREALVPKGRNRVARALRESWSDLPLREEGGTDENRYLT